MQDSPVKRFYDGLHANHYPVKDITGLESTTKRFRTCLSLLRKYQPRDLLEVGFENPSLSVILANSLHVNYCGVDISVPSVQGARSKGLNAVLLDVSQEQLPLETHSVDVVYCSEVLEHLYNPDFAVEEFKRVLRSDGKILITTPNLGAWYNRLALLVGIQPVHTEVSTIRIVGRRFRILGQGNFPVGHVRAFTLRGLLDFLALHNLVVVELQGYGLESVKRFRYSEACLAKFPALASGFIVLATPGSNSQ